MKPFRWGQEKTKQRMLGRGFVFEQMVVAVEAGGLLDVPANPHPGKYPNQNVLVVACNGYAYLIALIKQEDHFFLKTVIPSRKAARDYLKQGEDDVQD